MSVHHRGVMYLHGGGTYYGSVIFRKRLSLLNGYFCLQFGRPLDGGAHEISGIKALLFLHGGVV